jgi:hypothetical protein
LAASSTATASANPPASPATSGAGGAGSFPAAGFDATAEGALQRSAPHPDGEVTISLVGTLSGGATSRIDVELTGTPLSDGGVEMRIGTVLLSDGMHSYQGSVIGLGESQVVADMSGPGGTAWEVTIDFTHLDQQLGTMSADVHVAPGRQRGSDRGGDDR